MESETRRCYMKRVCCILVLLIIMSFVQKCTLYAFLKIERNMKVLYDISLSNQKSSSFKSLKFISEHNQI